MKVLFATAELAPVVKVGGLADASAGLVEALRNKGVEVDIVLPDYGDLPLVSPEHLDLDVPQWVGPATVRQGELNGVQVSLVSVPKMARPPPYIDGKGRGWPDNDERFLAFSMAVAAWATITSPDLIHMNDWHTGATLGFLDDPPPSVLTIHNLAFQGITTGDRLELFTRGSEAYDWGGDQPSCRGHQSGRSSGHCEPYVCDRVFTTGGRFRTTRVARIQG